MLHQSNLQSHIMKWCNHCFHCCVVSVGCSLTVCFHYGNLHFSKYSLNQILSVDKTWAVLELSWSLPVVRRNVVQLDMKDVFVTDLFGTVQCQAESVFCGPSAYASCVIACLVHVVCHYRLNKIVDFVITA